MKTVEKEIDTLGRVVIPKKFRTALGIKAGSAVLMSLEGGAVIISAKSSLCALCGEKIDAGVPFRLCATCLAKIKSAE